METIALAPTACPVHYPFVEGGPLAAVDLYRLSREEAGQEVMRLARERQPGIVVTTPDVFAFYAVRMLLEKAPQPSEQRLGEIVRHLWPAASAWGRSALELGYTYALWELGVHDAPARLAALIRALPA